MVIRCPAAHAHMCERGIKLLYWDGQGFCLYYKVLERRRFPWPNAQDGAVRMTSAQLAMLWAPLGTFPLEIPCRAKGDRLAAP
jgi:transposase